MNDGKCYCPRVVIADELRRSKRQHARAREMAGPCPWPSTLSDLSASSIARRELSLHAGLTLRLADSNHQHGGRRARVVGRVVAMAACLARCQQEVKNVGYEVRLCADSALFGANRESAKRQNGRAPMVTCHLPRPPNRVFYRNPCW